MTCYQRHMTWLFDELDLPYDKENRRRVDDALHAVLGLDADAHCPEVWAAIKALPEDRMAGLAPEVREALGA
jgi:hypothetical protein